MHSTCQGQRVKGAPKHHRGDPNPCLGTAREGSTGRLFPSHPQLWSALLCCPHTVISSFPPPRSDGSGALTLACVRRALARHTSCLCPTDRLFPLSPTSLSSPPAGVKLSSQSTRLCARSQTPPQVWGFPSSTQNPDPAQAQALGTGAFTLGQKQHLVWRRHSPLELGAGLSLRFFSNIHQGLDSSARSHHPIHLPPVPCH